MRVILNEKGRMPRPFLTPWFDKPLPGDAILLPEGYIFGVPLAVQVFTKICPLVNDEPIPA
jgi:hypothetical protein